MLECRLLSGLCNKRNRKDSDDSRPGNHLCQGAHRISLPIF
jgi:hypothetical protein